MKFWEARYKKRSWLFYLFAGFLWMGLAKVAFALLPTFPAILVSAGLFALSLVLFPSPTRKMADEDFKRELAESRKAWRNLNNRH